MLPHDLLVVDDEDDPRAALRRHGLGGPCRGGRVLDRQVDHEARASPLLAVDAHDAAVRLDDAVDGGEPETGPAPLRLGGEERLEDPVQVLSRDADARVRDREHHVGARREARRRARVVELLDGRLERERAAPGHRVAGVHGEVHDHLLQVARIAADVALRRAQALLDAHRLVERPAEERGHLLHHRVQVHVLLSLVAEPREREEAPRQVRRAVAGGRDGPRRLLDHAAGRRLRREHVGVAEDPDEQVVEVVRHAAGKQPDGLELLGVALRLLRAPLLPVRLLQARRSVPPPPGEASRAG